jgi:hypothetical protein
MSYIKVEIIDPRFRSRYPPKDILIGEQIGYFIYRQIPFFFEILEKEPEYSRPLPFSTREMFQASLLLSEKNFPNFVFPIVSYGDIYINTLSKISTTELITKVKKIIDGETEIPILTDILNFATNDKAMQEIERIRSEKEYLDLFHAKNLPLDKTIQMLSNSYEYSETVPNPVLINKFFEMIGKSPRIIHISIYYFINAARLIENYFIEDAAINLNLASEAIIFDYMERQNIKDKRLAIIQLLKDQLGYDELVIDWLIELYDARNEFLAHIDKGLFTSEQRISDPDAYCFDHYENIANLLIDYMEKIIIKR